MLDDLPTTLDQEIEELDPQVRMEELESENHMLLSFVNRSLDELIETYGEVFQLETPDGYIRALRRRAESLREVLDALVRQNAQAELSLHFLRQKG